MVVKGKPRHYFVTIGIIGKQSTFGQSVGGVNTGMIFKLLQKLDSVLTRSHLTAENGHVEFFSEWNLVVKIYKMAALVQFEQYGIGIVGLQVTALTIVGTGGISRMSPKR